MESFFEVYNQYNIDDLNKTFNFTINSIIIIGLYINITIIA